VVDPEIAVRLLEQNPIDSLEEALEDFKEKNKSTPLDRYFELGDVFTQAMTATIKPEAATTVLFGFFRGVEDDLAALCIVKK